MLMGHMGTEKWIRDRFRVSKGVREDSRINLTTLSKPSNFLINSLLHRLLEAVSKNDCTACSRLSGK